MLVKQQTARRAPRRPAIHIARHKRIPRERRGVAAGLWRSLPLGIHGRLSRLRKRPLVLIAVRIVRVVLLLLRCVGEGVVVRVAEARRLALRRALLLTRLLPCLEVQRHLNVKRLLLFLRRETLLFNHGRVGLSARGSGELQRGRVGFRSQAHQLDVAAQIFRGVLQSRGVLADRC